MKKSRFIFFGIGVFLAFYVVSFANERIFSEEMSFSSKYYNWNVTNVKEALNYLYKQKFEFDYTGNEQVFTVPVSANYVIEV